MQLQEGGLDFELNLFASLSGDFLSAVENSFRLIDLRTGNAAVKDVPRRTDARSPLVAYLVGEKPLVGNALGNGAADTGTPTGFGRTNIRFSLLDGVISHSGICAIFQGVGGAFSQAQMIRSVAKRILRADNRVGGQSDIIVQLGNRNVVLILDVDEILHGIGKFNLRLQNIDFGNGADVELSVDVAQMFLQSHNLFLVDFD